MQCSSHTTEDIDFRPTALMTDESTHILIERGIRELKLIGYGDVLTENQAVHRQERHSIASHVKEHKHPDLIRRRAEMQSVSASNEYYWYAVSKRLEGGK